MNNVAASAALAGAGGQNGLELTKGARALQREVHGVLAQIDYDYQRLQYNTVVSGAMKLLNALEAFQPAPRAAGTASGGASSDGAASDVAAPDAARRGDDAALAEGFSVLLRVLYPATPHIAEVLWQQLGLAGAEGELLDAPWPRSDAAALVQDEIELMLQINGKLRGALTVPASADAQAIEQAALASEAFRRHAAGAAVRKVVVVPQRLVNVVVA